MDDLDFWNFMHGTGAGCASIAVWESIHTLVTGPVLFIIYGGLTIVIFQGVQLHRKHLAKRGIGKPK